MMEELLRTLTGLTGPTGQEDAVLDWLAEGWEGRGEVGRSPVGNLTLRIAGPGPRVVLAAHADELSMIVRSVTPDGFLRVVPGERDQFAAPYFLGHPVRILNRANADLSTGAGVTDLVLGGLHGNDAARRLYERRGYAPTWLYLSKLEGRGRPAPEA